MTRYLVLALALFGCRTAASPIIGEWAGDLRLPAMTLPLEVTIDSTGRAATVSFRPWRLRAAAGVVSRQGDSLTITVPTEADTVRLRGSLGATRWSGSASRGAETAPFDVVRLITLTDAARRATLGTWRTASGGLVGIGMFTEMGDRPTLVDYASGRIGPLFPIGPGRFLLGHSIVAPIFPADTVEITSAGIRVSIDGQITEGSKLATRDEDLSFANGPIQLAGTLTLPEGPGPHPAVVLVHGSNAQTRETMGPWVRYFAGLGIAALAYDKRGTGGSTGDWKQADFPTLATDAEAAVRAIRARKDIRADQVGLWGISQAGWILPIVQNAVPEAIAFMIVHAGTGTTARVQGILNDRNELRAAGLPDSAIAIAMRYHELDDVVTKTGSGFEALQAFYRANRERAPWLGEPAPVDEWFRTYYRMLMDYDPAASWGKMTAPVLLFFGELDVNVPPKESWPPIERGLALAGNKAVTSHVLPSANHVFLEAKTGGRDEYPGLRRFVPGYFDRMAEWLRARLVAPAN